ncbi:magnesium/cobalt transporter CorA [Tenacibaculum aquimarinum]|uniref:magnesium/cobalt transporter CorA n=1 Tax=Tenacibaculum aquimarinum TaxID=2910675 RepID=UPI001F0A9720|nr:magnesium/cobalt transporter CorA [Tenacibaculum aquimarinum]MCH3882065.1 magnesium/cobalt transporter CorA [Tenacibaculum aquimarinum]MCH3885087.1 magnesium/cobalt transporter CorA [Tenacibaculum aquimarinum]
MTRFIINQKIKKGAIPGKPVFIGKQKEENVRIRLIGFDATNFVEIELENLNEIASYKEKYANIWINIDGLHDVAILKEVGLLFNMHPIVTESIAHTGSRAKVDIEENYIFTIIKMMLLNPQKKELEAEQVSMYLTKNILLTFQEKQGDIFEPIRERLRTSKGRVRTHNTTYLKYCLLDTIVENYNFLLEVFGLRVEELEDKILLQPSKNTLKEINATKIELNYFRKTIRPTKEAISNFKSFKTDLITKKEQPFFNDLNELIHRAHENLENYKSMLSEQLTVYSTNLNNRLNDIMKVLTMFSVIFIPITFIAGIYGTNFDYIPELKYKNSYFIMLGSMLFIIISMVSYFKYKKWF